MNRWSVRWETHPSTHPEEIARLLGIMPDLSEHEALVLAANKSRSFDTKPPALDHFKHLVKSSQAIDVKLYQVEPWRIREHWTHPNPTTMQSLTACTGEYDLRSATSQALAEHEFPYPFSDGPVDGDEHRLLDSGFTFASGLSRSNQDLQASIAAGLPVGVSVHSQLTEPMRRSLVDYVNSGGKLFIDSGSFTAFTTGSEVDWETVMGRYKELFYRVLPDHRHGLYFVAPDVIGDPEATAELNRECYGMFEFVMEDGGNMIVPIQKSPGARIVPGNVDDAWPRCTYPHRFILGIPFNKMAWSEEEVLEWLASNHVEDVRIHLLGGGPAKVRNLIAKAQERRLSYGTISGDSFHGPARDRKFQQRDLARKSTTHPLPSTPPMKLHASPAEESAALITAPRRLAFTHYQREDIARGAIHDGLIIAWDPGLGKTWAMFAWPFVKTASRVLIVAPAALHEQIITEGLKVFRVNVTPIPDQATALDLMRAGRLPFPSSLASCVPPSCASPAMPEFFITDYRWLGYNGADEWADGSDEQDSASVTDVIRRRRMGLIARHFGMPDTTIRQVEKSLIMDACCPAHTLLGVSADSPRSAVKAAFRNLARLTHPDLHPEDTKATARMQRLNAALESMLKGDASIIIKGLADEITTVAPTIAALMKGVGTIQDYPSSPDHSIKCLWDPSLSTLLADCFDCVVADESVRLKTGTTYIASGVLGLRSKYRLALTGTPIKNRLPDIFFLASWVTGSHPEATARWPYGNTTAHQSAFASNHLVMEENLTKEQKSRQAGTFRRYIKQTNKITNVHRLWKLLGPIVARRRKDSVGNDLVSKVIHPIRVLPGTAQQRVYKWHLDNPPECATPVAALGAQLQCLRQAALCPWSSSLHRPGQPGSKAAAKWSPKMLAILSLAADLMEKGEQLVVFSPFQEFSTAVKAALADAGVPSLLLDGRVKNTKRGQHAAEFKQGKFPVLIAGIDAMGEGHSFECASHLVIPSLSWAYDANRQAIERVHRLTSKKDVTIYLMITQGTIDERLASLFNEKGDSSDLALDGRLFEEDRREVSLAELLRSASIDFDPTATTIPEESLSAQWDTALRSRLAAAAKSFTMQRVTASASGCSVSPQAVQVASRPVSTKPLPERSHTERQPDFLNLMAKPITSPAPGNPLKSQISDLKSPPPTNVIPFPAKPKPSPQKIRALIAMLD